ncbi:MAG: Hpt domain-containing protein [Gemmatimonadota bacterium]
MNEYFASEATEYLDQLDRLLALPGMPDPEAFLRLATGVRGSAQMAGAETVAGVAERLEDAARSIVSRNIAWSEEIRLLAHQTVEDLNLLVRALNRWGEEEERRVREAIVRWEELDDNGEGGDADPEESQVVSIDELYFDDSGPHILGGDGAGAPATVPVDALLLRGEAALRAALALRPEFDRAASGGESAPPLPSLVDELFDLLELGLTSEPTEG